MSLARTALLCLALTPVASPQVLYVDAGATGADNGTSWDDAFLDLQDALAAASGGDQIWVASGTYWPTAGTDRSATFQLKSDVVLYGGFSGGELALEDRDPALNQVWLSGDLGSPGTVTDNSYHVVTADGVNSGAVLDGFLITGGYLKQDEAIPYPYGAGLMAVDGSPRIANCVFFANESRGGGAVGLTNSASVFVNCSFIANLCNETPAGGGAMRIENSVATTTTLTGCLFSANTAAGKAGGVWVRSVPGLEVISCTFVENTSPALRIDSSASIVNTVVQGPGPSEVLGSVTVSFSCIEGTCDPMFVAPEGPDGVWGTLDDAPEPSSGSPVVDAGDNSALAPYGLANDLAGNHRFVDDPFTPDSGVGPPPVVDIGAFEHAVDCDNDGLADANEIAQNPSLDCNGNGVLDACEGVAAPVEPASVAASPAVICLGGTSTLSATVPAGVEVDWYTASCGGGFAGTGTTLNVSPGVSQTYFARARDASSGCLSVTCAQASVTVDGPPVPTLTSPASQVICPGGGATLSVDAGGLNVNWYTGSCGGALLGSGASIVVNPASTQVYFAQAVDGAGCVSLDCAQAEVLVAAQPAIVAHPQDVTFCPGSTIVLDVSLDVEALPVAHQWRKNGIELADTARISGATGPILSITNAEPADAGVYDVVITDACSRSLTSAPAAVLDGRPVATLVSPATLPTTGGTVTLTGANLQSGAAGMTVTLRTAHASLEITGASVVLDPGGGAILVTVPPMPPGCGCGDGQPLSTSVTLENGCGSSTLSEVGLFLDLGVVSTTVSLGEDVQSVLDGALPGTCVVLEGGHGSAAHVGPLILGPGASALTLTSADLTDPGATKVRGLGPIGGPPPAEPALVLDGVGDDVCVSGLNFLLGNSGVEVSGGATPIIKSCKFDDNHADASRGGGVTVIEGSLPVIAGCDVLFNKTQGCGGGLLVVNAGVVLKGSNVIGNLTDQDGGGLCLQNTDPATAIVGNVIALNPITGSLANGGGVYWSSNGSSCGGLLADNQITGNRCDLAGAGVFVDGHAAPMIFRNLIVENLGQTASSRGGGLYIAALNETAFPVRENVFLGNAAQIGGGMFVRKKTNAQIERNLILGNEARQLSEVDPKNPAPAAYAAGVWVTDNDVGLLSNTIHGNFGFEPGEDLEDLGGAMLASPLEQGGGVHAKIPAAGSPQLNDNILMNNEGWEFFTDFPFPLTSGELENNVVFDEADPLHLVSKDASPGPLLEQDPLLVNPDDTLEGAELWEGFALSPGSPAKGFATDGADPGAAQAPGFLPGPCLPVDLVDCNENGIADPLELPSCIATDFNLDGVLDACQEALIGDTSAVSLSAGGSQHLSLYAGAVLGGDFYQVLGSLSGTSPGITIDGVHLPLNVLGDPYSNITLSSPGAVLAGSVGFLTPDGLAQTTFQLPAGTTPNLMGLTVNHAAMVLDALTFAALFASNAVPVELVP